MRSTMQDDQLTIGAIRRHVTAVHADSEVVTATSDGTRRRSYAELGERVGRLANALRALGIDGDQRVATFQWNNVEHLEAYLAVPSMGAVLHTLNIRLFPDQLVYIANHAEDQVVIVDDSLVGLLAPHVTRLTTVRHVLVAGPDAASADLGSLAAGGAEVHLYEDLLAAQSPEVDWPEIDENDAAAMCYTSGTTGNPKGVVYSHRSAWLHSQAVNTGNAAGLSFEDRVLPIVPMFHANAWGLAYSALMSGAALCLPDRWLQAEPLVRFIQESRPTVSGAVPTVWNDVLGLPRRPRRRPARLAEADPVRRVGGAGLAPEGPPGAARAAGAAGLGDDRDLAGGLGRDAAGGRLRGGGVGLPRHPGPAALRRRGADRRRRRHHRAPRRPDRRRARGPRPLGHRGLLPARRPRGRREVPRRLAAHRRRRHHRRAGLHHALRPRQGRDQVRGRVDLLGRPRERPDGPRVRRGGRRDRRARREVAGATAGRRGPARRAPRPPRRSCATSSPPTSPPGSCRTPSPSSTRCRAPRSASSTRR